MPDWSNNIEQSTTRAREDRNTNFLSRHQRFPTTNNQPIPSCITKDGRST